MVRVRNRYGGGGRGYELTLDSTCKVINVCSLAHDRFSSTHVLSVHIHVGALVRKPTTLNLTFPAVFF